MKLIIDVMGGDKAPEETVRGALAAIAEYGSRAEYILVGDEPQIRKIAEEAAASLDGIRIVHTESVITMEDNPVCVVRTKKDSSMSTALRMLAEGEGDAVVSTGNTGALFTGAMLIVKKIKHLQRAGIASILPLKNHVLLLDTGANVEVTEENLEQFAYMGAVYMKKLYGIKKPRVGLLNNGTESHKGTPLQQAAYARLSENDAINFIGNVEGNMVSRGVCDVLVTDGFTGNVFLKSVEGTGKYILSLLKEVFLSGAAGKIAYLMVKAPLSKMKKQLDPNETGGAPILGISKPVIKAHGSSNAKAFKNAIGQALSYAESGAIEEITAAMAEFTEKKKEDKATADVAPQA
ncbi:MAG: phosphate acyltransferase PlsX [Clostridia bacterium]|nr:phosphate acyltransferase PlsX [Clostridia bacterium]